MKSYRNSAIELESMGVKSFWFGRFLFRYHNFNKCFLTPSQKFSNPLKFHCKFLLSDFKFASWKFEIGIFGHVIGILNCK